MWRYPSMRWHSRTTFCMVFAGDTSAQRGVGRAEDGIASSLELRGTGNERGYGHRLLLSVRYSKSQTRCTAEIFVDPAAKMTVCAFVQDVLACGLKLRTSMKEFRGF